MTDQLGGPGAVLQATVQITRAETGEVEEYTLIGRVTSTVEIDGTETIRTYSDGAVQRNVWESEERAQEYAASVAEVEAE